MLGFAEAPGGPLACIRQVSLASRQGVHATLRRLGCFLHVPAELQPHGGQ